jgi:hypothetical protein
MPNASDCECEKLHLVYNKILVYRFGMIKNRLVIFGLDLRKNLPEPGK